MSQRKRDSTFWELYGKDPVKLKSRLHSGVIMDTEPLVVYLTGFYDMINKTNYIELTSHTKRDFDVLSRFLEQMSIEKFYVTPHTLAEFCSIVKKKIKPSSSGMFYKFASCILPQLQSMGEIHTKKDKILEMEEFKKYGITDISILMATKEKKLPTIVGDRPLYGLLEKNQTNIPIYLEEISYIK